MELIKKWFGSESEDEADETEEMHIIGDREFQTEYCKANRVRNKQELLNELEVLKKAEFILSAKISCWKESLVEKLEELKHVELLLNDKHEVIWKNREKFCVDADEFILNYGPFSDWWETQLNYVSDLENFKHKKAEGEKSREQIANLEREIEELEEARLKKTVADVEVHASANGDTARISNSESVEEGLKEGKDVKSKKKVRFADSWESEDEIKENVPEDDTEYFSLVDVNVVKTAKRIRNNQRKKRSRFSRFIRNNFVVHNL